MVEMAGRRSLQIFMVPANKKSEGGRDEKCQGISFILQLIKGASRSLMGIRDGNHGIGTSYTTFASGDIRPLPNTDV